MNIISNINKTISNYKVKSTIKDQLKNIPILGDCKIEVKGEEDFNAFEKLNCDLCMDYRKAKKTGFKCHLTSVLNEVESVSDWKELAKDNLAEVNDVAFMYSQAYSFYIGAEFTMEETYEKLPALKEAHDEFLNSKQGY